MGKKKISAPFNAYPYNMPVSFYFSVKIPDMEAEASFQEVSGINVSIETKPYEEGGVHEYVHKLPVRAKYDNLVLKRGLLHGSSLLTWINKAVTLFEFEPKQIEVSLLNSSGGKLITWIFSNAYPVAFKTSDFKAQDNSIVMETLEIAYNSFTREDVMQKRPEFEEEW